MEELSYTDQENLKRQAQALKSLRIPDANSGTLAERFANGASMGQIRNTIMENRRTEAARMQPGKSGGITMTPEEKYDALRGRVLAGRNTHPEGIRIGQRGPTMSELDLQKTLARNRRVTDEALRDIGVDVNMAAKGGKTRKRIKRDPRALRRKKAVGRKK